MRISRDRKDAPDINLTPLIDVVFLLLIFFMVSTTFQRESELGIELPEASTKADPTRKGHVEVSVDAKGRYYVNGRALVNTQRGTLAKALKGAADALEKRPPVVISADENAPHRSVMMVLDVAQTLNLNRLRFATRLEAAGDGDN